MPKWLSMARQNREAPSQSRGVTNPTPDDPEVDPELDAPGVETDIPGQCRCSLSSHSSIVCLDQAADQDDRDNQRFPGGVDQDHALQRWRKAAVFREVGPLHWECQNPVAPEADHHLGGTAGENQIEVAPTASPGLEQEVDLNKGTQSNYPVIHFSIFCY